jgi:hypothetical protein
MASGRESSIHKEHMRSVYRIRSLAILISLLMVIAGIVATFTGLQGSFDWAVQSPTGIGGKITNASPGILMVCVGFFLAWRIIEQPTLNVRTGITHSTSDSSRP